MLTEETAHLLTGSECVGRHQPLASHICVKVDYHLSGVASPNVLFSRPVLFTYMFHCIRVYELEWEGGCLASELSLHDEALAVVLKIDKKEVVNGLFRVCAYGAVGGVASLHTMEVKVESNRKFGILSIQFLTFPTEFRARPAPAGVVSVATVCTSEGSVCIAFCRPVGFRASLCWCCSCVRCDRSARHLAQRIGSFLSFFTLTKCWLM